MNFPRRFPLFLLLAAALLFASCDRKADPVEAANAFFQQVGSGQVAQAYESAAFAFKAQQNEKLFAQTAKEMGLTEFVSATWETPQIIDRAAKLRGEVTTKSGAKMPLVLSLTDESGAWRIFSIKKPRDLETGIAANIFGTVGRGIGFTAPVDRPVPDEKIIRQMTRETLLAFDDAVHRSTFEDFYKQTSHAWQSQLTVGALTRTFQPFIDKKVTLEGIRELPPIYDQPPYLNTEGLLVATGHFATSPYRVFFSLKFIYELPKWKLFGIDVNLQK